MNATILSQQPRRPIIWESWALTEEADRRFRKIVLLVALVAIAIGFLISLYKIEEKQHDAEKFNSTRYAQLLVLPKVPRRRRSQSRPNPRKPKALKSLRKVEEPKPASRIRKPHPKRPLRSRRSSPRSPHPTRPWWRAKLPRSPACWHSRINCRTCATPTSTRSTTASR